jgi:ribosomal protein L32
MKQKPRGGRKRIRVACPECGHRFTEYRRSGVKRFKPKLVGCPECGHAGRLGVFTDARNEHDRTR